MNAFKSIGGLLCLTALTLGSVTARAAVVGPVYPAPGGNTVSISGGPAGASGGERYYYSNFDRNAFSSLYWGPSSSSLPTATLDGTPTTLAFSSFLTATSGSAAGWMGQTTWLNPANSLRETASVYLVLENRGSQPWKDFSAVNGSDPTGVGAVVDNSAGVPLDIQMYFYAQTTTTNGWVPLNSVPQVSAPE